MKLNRLKSMSGVALAAALVIIGAGKATAATSCVNPGGTGGCYSSIQAAINTASSGDVINVAAGTYNESVSITKTLTLLGAQAGVDATTRVPSNESIINNACSPVQIQADNVILDGFTVQGSTMTDPCTIAGIYTNPGGFGFAGGFTIRNNIIQNNIIGIEMDNTGALVARVQHNLIQNNNNPGPDGGTGIDTNFGAINVLVDSNKFIGHTNSAIDLFAGGSNITWSNNEFASNSRAIGIVNVTSSSIANNNIHNSTDAATADLRIFGGVSGLTVTCNTFVNGAGRGIRIDNGFGVGANSMITLHFNNISGYPVAGLQVDTLTYSGGPGSLDATNDWWGSPSGPTIASNPGGTGVLIIDPDGVVKYNPFLTSPSTCAVCPNSNPGCTTTKKQCHAFVEQEEKNFNKKQESDEKAFEAQQKAQEEQFEATHPTRAQREAFEAQQKAAKKNFDKQQESAKDSFQAHYKTEERQCNQLK